MKQPARSRGRTWCSADERQAGHASASGGRLEVVVRSQLQQVRQAHQRLGSG